ncbi:hypothetical protein BIV57_06770 [Mangrovactinospora gilvigrisea]|uniref:DNA ligase (ATP) n=2 Tax=Mangrovactinospora gilvigrisea TaxID=1428644 RepID=A0A1J7BHR6_9ACTN|nr:hypothetical protein BIV57_06770 [Mangrovactinospora gilvigrisea]
MLATAGAPPDAPDWCYEVKWDGARCLLAADAGGAGSARGARGAGGSWEARSRAGNDFGPRFPELAEVTGLGRSVVLDGELVALDAATGRPSFALLQPRLQAARARPGAAPVVLMAFDLLRLDGESLLDRPLAERRRLLEGLGAAGPHLTVPPVWPSLAPALAFVADHELEGVVAKRLDSPYRPGVRSPDWIKQRRGHRTAVALVIGWTPDERGDARSLHLALPAADGSGGLAYAGRVGSGITDRTARDLAARLAPLAADRSAVPVPAGETGQWVRPQLAVAVAYLERTTAGRLRQPVFEHLAAPGDQPAF